MKQSIKLSTIQSKKGNNFLVLENNRFHPAGSSTWLTADDVNAILDNGQQVEAFLAVAGSLGPQVQAQAPAPLTVLPPIAITQSEPVPAALTSQQRIDAALAKARAKRNAPRMDERGINMVAAPPVVMPAPKRTRSTPKPAPPAPVEETEEDDETPDPKNAAGQTDITANLNPRVAALVQRAMGTKFASLG